MIVAEHEHNSPNQQRGIVVSSYSKQKQEEKHFKNNNLQTLQCNQVTLQSQSLW